VARAAAPLHRFSDPNALASSAGPFVELVGGRLDFRDDPGALLLQLRGRLLVGCGAGAGYLLLPFPPAPSRLSAPLRPPSRFCPALGFAHQLQNPVFHLRISSGRNRFRSERRGTAHLVLARSIWSLSLRDLLAPASGCRPRTSCVPLIGGERGAVGLEFALVRYELLLDIGDVFGLSAVISRVRSARRLSIS